MHMKTFLGLLVLLNTGLFFVTPSSATPREVYVATTHFTDDMTEHNEESSMRHGSAGMEHDEVAHEHMHPKVPHKFEGLSNPFAGDDETLAAGQVIFATNCAVCHGMQGKGNGPGAAELNPKPSDLADGHMMEMLTDAYLFWRVSEGGQIEPFNSAMPPWKVILSAEQRWQVISYVRSFTDSMHNHMEEEHHYADEDGHMSNDEHHEEGGSQHMEVDHHAEESK